LRSLEVALAEERAADGAIEDPRAGIDRPAVGEQAGGQEVRDRRRSVRRIARITRGEAVLESDLEREPAILIRLRDELARDRQLPGLAVGVEQRGGREVPLRAAAERPRGDQRAGPEVRAELRVGRRVLDAHAVALQIEREVTHARRERAALLRL